MRRALLLIFLLALLPMPALAQDVILDLRDELRSCYNLDEISGTRYDTVGYANLTDVNTVTHVLGVSPQTRYGAYFVSANSEYLNGNDVHDFTSSFSLAGWFSTAGTDGYIVSNGGSTGQYYVKITNNPTLQLRVVSTYAQINFVADSTWHFFYAYYDAVAGQIGISIDNGVPTTAIISTTPYYSAAEFQLGTSSDSVIDSLAVWQRTLNTDELAWLYNSGAGRNCNEIANIYDDNPREIITLSSGKLGQLSRSVSYGDIAVVVSVLGLVGLTILKTFYEFIHSQVSKQQ